MNLKTLTALAATVLATSAWAAGSQESKCGAGSCGKKESSSTQDASCSKKDGGCSKKDAGCSKKDGGCSKKEGAETK